LIKIAVCMSDVRLVVLTLSKRNVFLQKRIELLPHSRMGNSASIAPRERAAIQARGLAATVRAAAALEAKDRYWRDET